MIPWFVGNFISKCGVEIMAPILFNEVRPNITLYALL